MNDPGRTNDHREIREALGAYVLGGLEPGERRRLDVHLESCPDCREELGRLSVLPPLLARLDADEAAADLAAQAPDVVPGLLAAVGRERRRTVRRVRAWQGTAAAAAAAAVLIAWSPWSGSPPADVVQAAIRPVAADAAATTGTVDAIAWEWGTTVQLDLTSLPAREAYVMWAVAGDGRRQQAGTWGSTSHRGATVRGAAAMQRDAISRIEVTDREGEVLFVFDLPRG